MKQANGANGLGWVQQRFFPIGCLSDSLSGRFILIIHPTLLNIRQKPACCRMSLGELALIAEPEKGHICNLNYCLNFFITSTSPVTSPPAFPFFLRQRSLQYFTCSQSFAHFFLQTKGLPQVWQIFSGRKIFLCAIMPLHSWGGLVDMLKKYTHILALTPHCPTFALL